MATIKEIKQQAATIKNATQVGENTAERVGGVLEGLSDIAQQQEDKLSDLAVKDEDGTPIFSSPFQYIQNEEFVFAMVDAEDRFLFGIQADGSVEWQKGVPAPIKAKLQEIIDQCLMDKTDLNEAINAAKEELEAFVASVADTKVDKEDGKSLIDSEVAAAHSVIDNPEYLAVETDADDKVLAATYADGSHYAHNLKSETIPEEFVHIEDPEDRMEITTDADGKVLGYRDSEGTRHEHKMSLKHLELSDEAATEVNNAFKSAGIKMENPSDFSNYEHIDLPIPRIAAQVKIYAPKLPTTKTDDIEAEIEYNDKDGNYFRKPVILNVQGSSSMDYYVKNMAIDLNDGSEIKFGDFPTQDSFHLKKYYIDNFRGQCIVGYWLMEQVYKSRPLGQQYPYEYNYSNDSVTDGLGDVKKDFFTGAKCHPDGFPIVITWVSTKTNEETQMGIYAWNLKKSKEVYGCNKKTAENIILDGVIGADTLFGGNIQWNQFEIRNPKSLIDINGNKYDGDNPKELSDTDTLSKTVKAYIQNLSSLGAAIKASDTKETYAKYLLINPTIDYILLSQVVYNFDGFLKNWIWVTYDGKKWCPTAYDMDSIFGSHWRGIAEIPYSESTGTFDYALYSFMKLYKDEMGTRYKDLRDLKIFDAENIVGLLNKWLNTVGFDNLKEEYALYPETPSYRDSKINKQWELADTNATQTEYSDSIQYSSGNLCSYKGATFRAKESVQGIPPLFGTYEKFPEALGFYNSPKRVYNWLIKRIAFLDNYYSYK